MTGLTLNRSGATLLMGAITLAQPLAGMLAPVFRIGRTMGERAGTGGIPPELPPGPFFFIWLVIFALYLPCTLAAWLAWDRPVVRRATPWLALTGLAGIAWMVSNQLIGWRVLDLALIVPVFALAVTALARALSPREGGWAGTVITATSGLLAGWLTMAVSISVAPVLREAMGWGGSDRVWAMAALTLIMAGGLIILVRRTAGRSLFYLAAIAWGLAGIVVNNFTRTGTGLIGWTVIGFAVIGAIALWSARGRGTRHA